MSPYEPTTYLKTAHFTEAQHHSMSLSEAQIHPSGPLKSRITVRNRAKLQLSPPYGYDVNSSLRRLPVLDLLTTLDPAEIISAIFVTLGSTLAVWYRKKLTTLNKFWGEVLNGLRAVPELQKDVKGIIYFVSPNGGGSLMDSAKRTEAAVTQVAERLEMLTQTVWAEHDTDEEIARFHCNQEGENTYVNQTYARWVGVGKEELLGWGFINVVHPDDVVRVRAHWEQCRKEHRQYRMAHRMLKPDGSVFNVNVVATPIPENSPNVKRWVGYIRKARQEGE